MMSEEDLAGQAGRRLATGTADWLVSHPETRNARGEHVVVPAPRDMLVSTLFSRVAEHDHPVIVIYESAADQTVMVVVTALDPDAVRTDPYPAATLTVGDLGGLRRLFGDDQFVAVADDPGTTNPDRRERAERWGQLLTH